MSFSLFFEACAELRCGACVRWTQIAASAYNIMELLITGGLNIPNSLKNMKTIRVYNEKLKKKWDESVEKGINTRNMLKWDDFQKTDILKYSTNNNSKESIILPLAICQFILDFVIGQGFGKNPKILNLIDLRNSETQCNNLKSVVNVNPSLINGKTLLLWALTPLLLAPLAFKLVSFSPFYVWLPVYILSLGVLGMTTAGLEDVRIDTTVIPCDIAIWVIIITNLVYIFSLWYLGWFLWNGLNIGTFWIYLFVCLAFLSLFALGTLFFMMSFFLRNSKLKTL